MKLAIAVIACFVGLAFGAHIEPKHGSRIVHGEDADIRDFKYQVSVLYNNAHFCGGSVIAPNVVLTAAHCTDGRTADAISVHVGDTSSILVSTGQVVAVSRIIQHEGYVAGVYHNDISLLVLQSNLQYNDRVQQINLATREPANGANAVVSGWGTTSEGGSVAHTLQKVNVPIIGREQCKKYYSRITDAMICAGYEDGYYDSCQGDSGGPLVVNGVQVGIVSWGSGCARPMKPGVYASVAVLIGWIDDQFKSL